MMNVFLLLRRVYALNNNKKDEKIKILCRQYKSQVLIQWIYVYQSAFDFVIMQIKCLDYVVLQIRFRITQMRLARLSMPPEW